MLTLKRSVPCARVDGKKRADTKDGKQSASVKAGIKYGMADIHFMQQVRDKNAVSEVC